MMKQKKRRINVFEACDIAAAMLISAGFDLKYQSSRTEARYYALPDREPVIRVAAHRARKPPIGLSAVVARITFFDGSCETPHHVAMSDEKLENTVATAIGMYMLKSMRPMPRRYHGKRGTWEQPTNVSL